MGVDVGGTKSAAVLVDSAGSTLARHWFEHGGATVSPLRDIVLGSIDGVLASARLCRNDVDGYGIAVAGLISSDQSTVVNAAKLNVRHSDLGGQLSTVLQRSVLVHNDANATMFGHRQRRAHRGERSGAATEVTVLFTLGTGIGGAVMAGGRTILGMNGFAAELGHITVDYDDERLCLCGSPGCVENYCCGRGVEELASMAPPSSTSRELGGLATRDRVTCRHVLALASVDDEWAIGLLNTAGRMLGRAISILCTAFDPSEVVIGGSFGHAAERWLVPAAMREMERHWPFAAERPPPQIAVDAIGPYAAATGAALLAMVTSKGEDC